MDTILSVKDLYAGYRGLNILWGVNIEVRRNEVVSIIGPNGAGKTTLLKAISGLVMPTKGEINFNEDRINDYKPHTRVDMGLTFVPSERELFPELTVEENLELGAYTKRARNNMSKSLEQIYEFFPRLDERRDQLAGTLSGGEQQMLAIARALMLEPDLILMDEPTEGLMPLMVTRIKEVVHEINERGVSVLLVEQNAKMALETVDRVYIMEKGTIKHQSTPEELKENPEILVRYLGVKA